MEKEMKIFASAERILARRMITTFELQKKLLEKFPGEKEKIQKVLEKCKEYGFLDDEKYAETFLRYESQRAPKSEFFLRKKLKEKGISDEIIQNIFQESPLDEKEMAKKIVLQKKRTFSPNIENQKQKEKLFRFLMGRGFSFSLAREVLDEVFSQEENI